MLPELLAVGRCGTESSYLLASRIGSLEPGEKQLVTHRQNDRANKQADDAHEHEPADCAKKHHRNRNRNPASQQDGLQHVVRARCRKQNLQYGPPAIW